MMRFVRCLACILVMTVVVGAAPRAMAQPERGRGATPPRLRFFDGQVSFWRPGAEDWAPAQVNTALAAGDSLYVASGGNAEIEIGGRAFVRAGSDTQLNIASVDPGYLQVEVTSGHAALDLKRLPEGQEIELDTPSGAFTIERAGYYRADVDDSTTFTVRQGGAATVTPAGGESADIGNDQQAVLEGTETATINATAAPAPDEWDRWNLDRTARLTERPRSAEYVAPPVAGLDDLDEYGEWRDAPQYGHVWVPRDVPPDWAPYSTGSWVWDPSYEWTWVDDAPWGWAPYHYGRWCHFDGYWGWAPGPVVAAPIYAPALVAFFDVGGVGVSVGAGAPFVSWVALGWGEPIVPWWGPPAFIGHPYWGGWGGPRVVNNVVINNTTIVNVRNINHFTNVDVRNAVVGAPRDRFGRGRIEHVRLSGDQFRQAQPLHGKVPVRPVPQSLVPREGRGQRPPDRIQNRRVVATRPPHDPTPRLRAAGIETRGPARPVEPRVVQPTRGRAAAPGRERERGGRMTAPPPPGGERAPGRGMEREPGNRGPGRERGPMNEPGAAGGERDHGRRAVPPPPAAGERGPGRERGRERPERGPGGVERQPREAVPPPVPGGEGRGNRGERAPRMERGGPPERAPTEHGRPAERAPAMERGGDRRGGDRGRPPMPPPGRPPMPPPAAERAPRENVERGHHAPPSEPRMERGGPAAEPRMERRNAPGREPQTERGAPPRSEPRPERVAPPRPERGAPPPEPRIDRHGPPPGAERMERRGPPPGAERIERGAPPRQPMAERNPPPPRAAPEPGRGGRGAASPEPRGAKHHGSNPPDDRQPGR